MFEIELLPGLRPFAEAELHAIDGVQVIPSQAQDAIRITYDGPWHHLHSLRTAVAVYRLLSFDIPRPKALLWHQYFTAITKTIHRIRSEHESGAFADFTLSAAGRDSAIFRRFRDELSEAAHLNYTPDEADLVVRVRAAPVGSGWDVLLRTTPRPLGTRDWRVVDMPGALHATIAAAMLDLIAPRPQDVYLNLMSGSGTLLIEAPPAAQALGVERDATAHIAARQNLQAAGSGASLLQMDSTNLGLRTASVDCLTADLPWGHLVGDYATLDDLYTATLEEAARVAKPGARFAVITHAIEKFEAALSHSPHWHTMERFSVFQGGLHPRIYLLENTHA